MIPASYLFKDIYRQHWEEPAAPVVVEKNRRFIDGLMTPVAAAIGAVFHRPTRAQQRYFGGHAYE